MVRVVLDASDSGLVVNILQTSDAITARATD